MAETRFSGKAWFLLLSMALLLSAVSGVAAEELDVFLLIEPDVKNAGQIAEQGGTPEFSPGQTIQIVIGKSGLRASRGTGAVRWFFKIYSATALLLVGDTHAYRETVTATEWNFAREISFTIPESFDPGPYRIEIYLEDMIGGTFYADTESFTIVRKESALEATGSESQPETEPAAISEYRLSIDSVDLEIVETSQTGSILTVSFLIVNNGNPVWIGILDAAFADGTGSYIKALKTGIIQADGWGGVDLGSGERKMVRISFDTGKRTIHRIQTLDLYLRGKERVSIEEIPVPWRSSSL